MSNRIQLTTLCLAALFVATPAQAAPDPAPASKLAPAAPAASTKPYLTVNGTAIPQYVVDAFIAEQKALGADTTKPDFQAAVRDEMIRRGALLSEAKKLGLDKKADYKRQMELASQIILMRDVVVAQLGKSPVSDEELQAVYNALIVKLGTSEYKVRHIQQKTEAAAREIIAKLVDGKKFEKLVKDTTDESTQATGGDLGWKSPATLPGGAANAVQTLKKGEFTKTPVLLGTNWHVFYVEDIRPLTPPKFDEVKPRLTQSVIQAKTAQYIESLKTQAQVK
jgi:peptidyl-prolyl cis-trans isomerase C